ncbi:MAG: protein kinase [Sandaracinaceae bacterium]
MSELELPASIGPFRIVRRLGAGGMAETFEGMREGPGGFAQRVCVKRVLPTYEQNEELGKLFLREARLAAELSHRAITRIVELGEDGAGHYLAMELVDGPDLRTLLRRQPSGRLPRALAVLVAVEIASALEHAHARGIAHRDVSPANVLIGRDGDVKLTDFGIAKAIDSGLAISKVVRGNLFYMAPERLEKDAPVRPSADLFSLGVLLFECLAGTRPWRTPAPAAALRASAPPVSLRGIEPGLPEPLHRMVEGLVSFDPRARPSARAVVEALVPLVRESAARRTLGELAEAAREEPPAEPSTQPPPSAARDAIPTRWRRYAVAPRAWADVDAAQQLRTDTVRSAIPKPPAPTDETTTPALPVAWGSPSAWAALALASMILIALVAVTIALAG